MVLVSAYKVVKEYADADNEDWGYESCYDKLKEIMTSDK